jgi:hypothetical protein
MDDGFFFFSLPPLMSAPKNQRFRAKGAFSPKGECTFRAQRELSRESCRRRRGRRQELAGRFWLDSRPELSKFFSSPTIKQTKQTTNDKVRVVR